MTSKIIFTLVITITAMLSLVSSTATNTFSYTGCQSNEDCMPGYCCRLTPDRYSVPACNLLKEEGETCIPKAPTLNSTLSYPDGHKIEVTNVYYVMCPCSSGLTCVTPGGVCKDLRNDAS